MDIERAITILTEEIEDHLPEEKWQDYEDALTVVLKRFEYLEGKLSERRD